jgi:hypothetical protein
VSPLDSTDLDLSDVLPRGKQAVLTAFDLAVIIDALRGSLIISGSDIWSFALEARKLTLGKVVVALSQIPVGIVPTEEVEDAGDA